VTATTEDTQTILTADEADALAAMRLILERVADRLEDDAYDAVVDYAVLRGTGEPVPVGAANLPRNYGMLAEACSAAETAIFNVLNIAQAYLKCEHSRAVVNPVNPNVSQDEPS